MSTFAVPRYESFDSIASVDFLVEELSLDETKDGSEPVPSAMRKREIAGEIKEPLLEEDKSRFVLFPIKHHDVRSLPGPYLVITHFGTQLLTSTFLAEP